jgi:hypothetical protein
MSKARDTVEALRTVLVDGDVTNANFTGADLEIGKGGTGASTAGAARTALGLAIGSDVQAFNAAIMVDGDIGTTVQAHDADTAKLDANANFTGTLQRGGTDVLVTGDVTNANFTGADLEIAKGGTGASSAGAARTALGLAIGSDVQAYDANIMVDGDIGTSVQAYDADTSKLDVAETRSASSNFADNVLQRPVLKDYGEVKVAMAAHAVDLELGNVFTYTLSGGQTVTFTNPPASGTAGSFTMIVTNGGSATLTWPTSVDWPAATAPTLTASGVDVLFFTTIDGGTIWYGTAVLAMG